MQSSVGDEVIVLPTEPELLEFCAMDEVEEWAAVGSLQGLSALRPVSKSWFKVPYTFAFFAANEPPTAAATMARTATKASATLKIRVVGRSLQVRQPCGYDGS